MRRLLFTGARALYKAWVTPRTALLLSWIVVGAALLVLHARVLVDGLRWRSRWRWLALFPPAAPFVAWGAGRRVAPIAWAVALVTYVVLRLLGA